MARVTTPLPASASHHASASVVQPPAQSRKLDLVINDPETADHEVSPVQEGSPRDAAGGPEAGGLDMSVTDGYLIRRTAIDFGVSLITNSKVAALLALSLERCKSFHIRAMEEYYSTTSVLDTKE